MTTSCGLIILMPKPGGVPAVLCVQQKFGYPLRDALHHAIKGNERGLIEAIRSLSNEDYDRLKDREQLKALLTQKHSPINNAIRLIQKCLKFVEPSQNKTIGTWSVPKGRCKHGEHALDTAVRETLEETGIYSTMYRIINYRKPLKLSYVGSDEKRYIQLLFLAIALEELPLHSRRCNEEIDELDLISITEVGDLFPKDYGRMFSHRLCEAVKKISL